MLGRERSVGASSVAWFCSALCSMKNLNPIGIKAAQPWTKSYTRSRRKDRAQRKDIKRHIRNWTFCVIQNWTPVGPGRSPWWLASSLIS